MIIAAGGIFSESLGFDIGVLCSAAVIIGTMIGLVVSLRQARRENDNDLEKKIAAAVSKAITANPDKVVVSPQPFVVEMKKEFVTRTEFDLLKRDFEQHRLDNATERVDIMTEISMIPQRTIELLNKARQVFL